MVKQKNTKNQWQVWLMMLILGGVIIAGFLIYPKTEDHRNLLLEKLGTTNYGDFVVPPAPIAGLIFKNNEDDAWILADQKPKWRMIIAGDGECVDRCRELIYLTRQIHISLGKYSRRFERLYLALDQQLVDETSAYLKLNHPFLKVIYGSREEFEVLLKNTNTPFGSKNTDLIRAYLVDQQGLVMMSYSLANKGNEIIEDIEHLMKYSAQ